MNSLDGMQTVLLWGLVLLSAVFIITTRFSGGRKREVPKQLQRSSNYRKRYFDTHKGLFGKGVFICPFCGRLMWKQDKMEIDHIVAIHRAQKSWYWRKLFLDLEDGVNNDKNLTHSCPRCNRRKGSRGGAWILLGFTGQYFMLPVRWACFGFLAYAVMQGILAQVIK